MIGLTHIIIAALLLTMPQGVAGVNSHRNGNSGVNRKGNSDGRMIVISSEHLRCDDTLLVFSPSGKEKARDLPVLFLLHGWSGNYTDWSRNKDLQKLADLLLHFFHSATPLMDFCAASVHGMIWIASVIVISATVTVNLQLRG